jgi:hypothetical protein
MRVTKEPVSHCALEIGGYVIHSDFLGVRAEESSVFRGRVEVVHEVSVPDNYPLVLSKFSGARVRKAGYDLGAFVYLGLRLLLPKLVPKKNLWQSSGMYLCTEWVTHVLDGKADSLITPYKLYLRLMSCRTK